MVKGARLPPMWPGFGSRSRPHMWVEFVVGSRSSSEDFSPSSQNSNSTWNARSSFKRAPTALWYSVSKQTNYILFFFNLTSRKLMQ